MLRYFRKRGNIRKRVCWNRRLRLLFTLCIKVSRKFYFHLFFKLRYHKQNGAKVLQITWGIWKTSNRQSKVQSWNLMSYFCPKNTFLQLEQYIPKIYLTLLSTTCVNIRQITYVIFETICKSFFTTQFLCIFLLKHYILFTKVAHQSASFQTFHCSA